MYINHLKNIKASSVKLLLKNNHLKNIKASSVELLLKKIVYLKNILGGSKEEKILEEGISI